YIAWGVDEQSGLGRCLRLPLHERVEPNRHGGGEAKVDAGVGHGHGVSVAEAHLPFARHDELTGGLVGEVEVERERELDEAANDRDGLVALLPVGVNAG